QDCCVCGKRGAAVLCREMGCERSFHLPCAAKGGCVTHYHIRNRYLLSPPRQHHRARTQHLSPHPSLLSSPSAFCSQHSPVQVVEAAPERDTTCIICLDTLEDHQMSFRTLVCPVCKNAWFHRGCIQDQALRDGTTNFRCPHCRDKTAFQGGMLAIGVHIPFR
ncbi:G2E3 ligase, partial [Baryphthengus martii]|nr:G2E3 ligase [Baryphthengus martii]